MNYGDNTRREDDETREMIEHLEREFGRRQFEDAPEQADSLAPRRGPPRGPVWGSAEPSPASGYPPRPVQLRLPLSRPRAVYALLAINVLMYGLTLVLTFLRQGTALWPFGDSFTTVLYQLGAKYGPAIDAGQYWRFLTPIVLHGGVIHLGFNSYALYVLGPEAERVYGTARFLAVYLLAGLAGTIASYVRSPGLSIGASGAIFGLIGALAAFFYGARSLIGAEASRQRVNQLIAMAAINIVLGFSIRTIDNAAHVGGLVAGAVAGLALAPRYRIDDQIYPPVVVRVDRPGLSWLMGGGVLVALIGWAIVAVGSR